METTVDLSPDQSQEPNIVGAHNPFGKVDALPLSEDLGVTPVVNTDSFQEFQLPREEEGITLDVADDVDVMTVVAKIRSLVECTIVVHRGTELIITPRDQRNRLRLQRILKEAASNGGVASFENFQDREAA